MNELILKRLLKELASIKKELQDIRSILEPKKVKVLIDNNVIHDSNQEN